MATIFPDVEILLRTVIVAGLAASTDSVAANVTVATKKPDPSVTPYPSKIVTIRGDGGGQLERDITKVERVGINVYVGGSNAYATASNLARLVEAIVRAGVGGAIKRVETSLSPVRVDTDATNTPEQRYMTFEVVVKAADL